MADRSLINLWLLEAADEAGDVVEAQIEWLRGKRREYSKSVLAGDHEVTMSTGEGGSTSSKRGVSDRDNHDAIVGALRDLGATDIGGGSLLQCLFTPTLG